MIEYKFSDKPRLAAIESLLLSLKFINRITKSTDEFNKKDYTKLVDMLQEIDYALAKIKKHYDFSK